MPLLIAALIGGLVQVATTILGRVLIAMGISWVTYSGLSTLIEAAEDLIKTKMQGLPGDMVQFLAWMNIDKALTMIFSAMVVSMALRGLTGGKLTKMVTKGV